MKPPLHPVPSAAPDVRRDKALGLLQDAYLAALHTRRTTWDFAVDLGELQAAGVTGTDLRGLLCEGLVVHALEEPSLAGPTRSFRRLATLMLPPGCCFVLTEGGFQQVQGRAARPASAAARPHWDAS